MLIPEEWLKAEFEKHLTEEELKKIDLKQNDLKKTFIKFYCLDDAFILLYSGRIQKFFIQYILGFITYPRIMMTSFFTYFLIYSAFYFL